MTTAWDQRLGFWWIAEDHPDSPAILAGPDGARTYAELAGDANQLVHLFRSLGAVPGDAIAAIVDNGTTLIEVSLACQQAGYYFIPLNTHLTAFELAAIMAHSGAKVLIAGERFAAQLADIDPALDADACSRSATIDGVRSLADARASQPRTTPDDRTPGGLFVYTSGTTGQAEGHPTAASRRVTSGRSPTRRHSSVGPSTSGPSTARCSCRPACSTAARTASSWVD